jgi:predicted acylesterase/phospholipase RssA
LCAILTAGLAACSPSTYFASYNNPRKADETGAGSASGVRAQLATLDLAKWLEASCWLGQETKIARLEPGVIPAAAREPDPAVTACVAERSRRDSSFVGLALSGGGARAAVFSAAVLFELDALGAMDHVDALSAVSGGAITAALYAISCDVDDPTCERTVPPDAGLLSRSKTRPEWREDQVFDKLSRSYVSRWIFNRLWPDNVLRDLFTSYDGTDVFAETLSDNLYDTSALGGLPFTFGDLNPTRPALIISATDYSESSVDTDVFTFTKDEFERTLDSDLSTFELGRAVAASSAYPGFFNYSTLTVWNTHGEEPEVSEYKHVFDGGASDNLALAGLENSLRRTLLSNRAVPDQLIFLSVDAQNGFTGVNATAPDPRNTILRIVDLNFLDAYDTLMERGYALTLDYLPERLKINLPVAIDPDTIHMEHIGLLTLNRQWFGYGRSSRGPEWIGSPGGVARYVKRPPHDPYRNHKTLLWQEIKKIETGYGLTEQEQACLRAAAYLLVNDKAVGIQELLDLAPSSAAGEREANFQKQYNLCVAEMRTS